MVRINLLPREIIERRKWERWYAPVIIAGCIALGVSLAVGGVFFYLAQGKVGELQQTTETVTQLTAQANSFAIFEQKEAELQSRKAVAQQALAGRINWGKICANISLMLPEEVWITTLTGDEAGPSVTIAGMRTPDAVGVANEGMDEGFKSVAKTLVVMNYLFTDVWTTGAGKMVYSVGGSSTTTASVVEFDISAKVNTVTAGVSSTSTTGQ